MLSAHTKFLSHSDKNADLKKHLLLVAEKSKELYQYAKFDNLDMIYYAGLLHDLGKLNPWYQLVFNGRNKEDVDKEYERQHSVFSAWAANILLRKKLNSDLIDKVLVLIYGHHTKLNHRLGDIKKTQLFDRTQKETFEQIPKFILDIQGLSEFDGLNWEYCKKRFCEEIQFDIDLKSNDSPKDFLDMSYAFSCLLQADRGSFSEWSIPNFDLHMNTTTQVKEKSNLGNLRTKFQDHVLQNFNTHPILIISAPTGIGKTKAFLDIIKNYTGNVERVFYFSPLLALTEDFEKKLASTISLESEQNDVLIYNHLHSESLAEKNDERTSSERYVFTNESFNKKLIVTTTQRLLLTLFSNKHRDKIKLASMRNSLLIIDEVQTIPKPILANLESIFNAMNKHMGTRFLLVSATIPHEIKQIPTIELPKKILDSYLLQTKKQISLQPSLDVGAISDGKVLVMANTRKKAVFRFSEIQKKYRTENREIIYMSTGVRKKDRRSIIDNLSKSKLNCILVATQVVEAGVDISFTKIFREVAPLDSIIQVMGRLNREGDDDNANLTIYGMEQEDHIPYSPLEYKITKEKITNITNSTQVYNMLEEYYKEISDKNRSNAEDAETLKNFIHNMDFEGVWKFVKKNTFEDSYGDVVLIPDNEVDWEETKRSILDMLSSKYEKKSSNKILKRFGDMTASLPISYTKIGIEKFDEDLERENILMPKKEYLKEIYDKYTGLDKWLQE